MKRQWQGLTSMFAAAAIVLMVIDGAALAQQQNQRQQQNRQQQQRQKMNNGQHKFLKQASMIDTLEIQLGKLALQKTSNQHVRKFAQRMVDEHQRIQAYLKRLANRQNATLPGQLDAEHQKMVEQLTKLQGDTFDRQYIDHMVKGHANAIKTFEAQEKNGKNADVRAWAGETVIILKYHHFIAQQVQDVLEGKTPRTED